MSNVLILMRNLIFGHTCLVFGYFKKASHVVIVLLLNVNDVTQAIGVTLTCDFWKHDMYEKQRYNKSCVLFSSLNSICFSIKINSSDSVNT